VKASPAKKARCGEEYGTAQWRAKEARRAPGWSYQPATVALSQRCATGAINARPKKLDAK